MAKANRNTSAPSVSDLEPPTVELDAQPVIETNTVSAPPAEPTQQVEAIDRKAVLDEFVSHQDDPMLNFVEAGELIGKSAQTIRRWVAEGLLDAVQDPSGLFRIRKSEVAKFYSASALSKPRPQTIPKPEPIVSEAAG